MALTLCNVSLNILVQPKNILSPPVSTGAIGMLNLVVEKVAGVEGRHSQHAKLTIQVLHGCRHWRPAGQPPELSRMGKHVGLLKPCSTFAVLTLLFRPGSVQCDCNDTSRLPCKYQALEEALQCDRSTSPPVSLQCHACLGVAHGGVLHLKHDRMKVGTAFNQSKDLYARIQLEA
jgi:hypothetical protein